MSGLANVVTLVLPHVGMLVALLLLPPRLLITLFNNKYFAL